MPFTLQRTCRTLLFLTQGVPQRAGTVCVNYEGEKMTCACNLRAYTPRLERTTQIIRKMLVLGLWTTRETPGWLE